MKAFLIFFILASVALVVGYGALCAAYSDWVARKRIARRRAQTLVRGTLR